MEAVNATTPLQCLFEDPMGNVAHALVQAPKLCIKHGRSYGVLRGNAAMTALPASTKATLQIKLTCREHREKQISLRNKQKSEELVKAQGL